MAWPRCRWAAGPGRASPSDTSAAGVEGAGGPGGHGRASRSTTPSEARVWRSRGRPGPTAPGTPAAPQATPAAPQATKTPEPEAVPGSGGGGWGIRTPEGLHPTRFPSVRHRPLGESSVHIVPDNHKRKMSSRANPGQWSRSQARDFRTNGIETDTDRRAEPTESHTARAAEHTDAARGLSHRIAGHPCAGPRLRRLAEPEHVDVGGDANKNPIEHEGGGRLP